jgi:hypothetical protein
MPSAPMAQIVDQAPGQAHTYYGKLAGNPNHWQSSTYATPGLQMAGERLAAGVTGCDCTGLA